MERHRLEQVFNKLIDPEGPIRCGDPSEVENVRGILSRRPFEGLEHEDGRPCDVLLALQDPRSLGDLAHIYRKGKLAAVVETRPAARYLQFVQGDLHLTLDLTPGLDGKEHLRLFTADCMLILGEDGKRELVRPDRSLR